MGEMIEKCARAAAISVGLDPDECVHGSGGTGVESVCLIRRWEQYAPMAAAVIDALMEPTEAMLDAGSDAMWEGIDYSLEPGEGIDGMDSSPVWHAMLSKAKSE